MSHYVLIVECKIYWHIYSLIQAQQLYRTAWEFPGQDVEWSQMLWWWNNHMWVIPSDLTAELTADPSSPDIFTSFSATNAITIAMYYGIGCVSEQEIKVL